MSKNMEEQNNIQKEVWQIENHLGFPDDFDF